MTAVWGSYNNNGWTSPPVSDPNAANGVNSLLAFTAGGVKYSTGVNDGATSVAGAVPAVFKAFTPIASSIPNVDGLNAIPSSAVYDPTKSRAAYLTDGGNGLDLNTALFNMPATVLRFEATVGNPAAINDTVYDILVTQVGQPGASDAFKFVDAAGNTVGVAQSITFANTPSVAKQSWQFWNPNHAKSNIGDGTRDLRMRAYHLSDFGITPTNMGRIAGFVQQLSGASDVAFIAYNQTAISTPPILSVQKSNGVNELLPNSDTHYTVTLSNTGGTTASAVQWIDTPSANLTVTSITPQSANASAGTCTSAGCVDITILHGESFVYDVVATVGNAPANSSVTNTAAVSGGNCNNGTANPGSADICGFTDTDTIVNTAGASITKTNLASSLIESATTLYTVTVSNGGGSILTGVSWNDFPSNVVVTSITPTIPGAGAGTCTPTGCTGIRLEAGASREYGVLATVTGAAGTTAVNRVSLVAGSSCTVAQPCTATESTPIVTNSRLSITKSNGVDQVTAGLATSYTVTLVNSGGTAASDVQWTDIPSGLIVSGISAGAAGANSIAGTCTTSGCTGITLGVGESIVYTVNATVSVAAGTQTVNTARVLGGANCSTATHTPAECEAADSDNVVSDALLTISKSNGVNQLTVGSTTAYTVTLANSGETPAHNVQWTDVSSGMVVNSITASTADANSVAGSCTTTGCTGISLGAGESIVYTVIATITGVAGTSATNTASALGGPSCTSAEPCSATDTDPIVQAAAISITKSNGLNEVSVDSASTYIVTLTNTGGVTATGVQWTDMPTGMTVNSISVEAVGANSIGGTCTVAGCTGAALAPGESIAYAVATTITGAAGSTANNIASVAGGPNCSMAAPCTATDADPVVAKAQPALMPVPMDSRVMLALLSLLVLCVVWLRARAR
ncbi:MAG: hypothetical protein RSF42_16660 [Comamonas sp.]